MLSGTHVASSRFIDLRREREVSATTEHFVRQRQAAWHARYAVNVTLNLVDVVTVFQGAQAPSDLLQLPLPSLLACFQGAIVTKEDEYCLLLFQLLDPF